MKSRRGVCFTRIPASNNRQYVILMNVELMKPKWARKLQYKREKRRSDSFCPFRLLRFLWTGKHWNRCRGVRGHDPCWFSSAPCARIRFSGVFDARAGICGVADGNGEIAVLVGEHTVTWPHLICIYIYIHAFLENRTLALQASCSAVWATGPN